MEKTLAWVFGIISLLGIAGLITFIVLWNKEKTKGKEQAKKDAATALAQAGRLRPGTKALIRGEICEWNGSNWVNCKKATANAA
jgi:hypothetical protein